MQLGALPARIRRGKLSFLTSDLIHQGLARAVGGGGRFEPPDGCPAVEQCLEHALC